MKAIYLLAIACFVSCDAQGNATGITEYCEEQCKNVCVPCNKPVTCTEDQRDCGLDKPDPEFGGVCPAHSVCVPKDFNCMSIMVIHFMPFCYLYLFHQTVNHI